MNTEKQMKLYYFTWILLTILFNIVVFAITDAQKRSTVIYWISYAAIMFVLVVELLVTRNAVKAEQDGRFRYRIPVLTACTQFLIFTVIAATLFLSVPVMPAWLGMLLCIAFGVMNVSLIRHAQAAVPEGKEIAVELEAALESRRAARNADLKAKAEQKEAEKNSRKASEEEKKRGDASKAEAPKPRYVKYGSDKEKKNGKK